MVASISSLYTPILKYSDHDTMHILLLILKFMPLYKCAVKDEDIFNIFIEIIFYKNTLYNINYSEVYSSSVKGYHDFIATKL